MFIPNPTYSRFDSNSRLTRTESALKIAPAKHSLPGGTFSPVVLLCQFFVLAGNRFWFYILLMYSGSVPYSCGVVLVFLVLAGNSFWCYVRT